MRLTTNPMLILWALDVAALSLGDIARIGDDPIFIKIINSLTKFPVSKMRCSCKYITVYLGEKMCSRPHGSCTTPAFVIHF